MSDRQGSPLFGARTGMPQDGAPAAIVTIELDGELDAASSDECFRVCTAALTSHVVVDLGGLTFMDASGFRALEHARAHLERFGGSLVWRGADGEPARFLQLVEASGRFAQLA